ncbi:hypothetical protein DEO72_LG7g1623 [Vigna unguiculata]|uniref:Uncharacterized protein n=1 Tax=Vigna unguiculata TaxID=3917 RepID=A0A4D6MFX8_VIGUN|nr:hypothetical protein DEO72_LG7g1623 [Vigna unguiculata]
MMSPVVVLCERGKAHDRVCDNESKCLRHVSPRSFSGTVGLVAWWLALEHSQFAIWVRCSGKTVCFGGALLLVLVALLLRLLWRNR